MRPLVASPAPASAMLALAAVFAALAAWPWLEADAPARLAAVDARGGPAVAQVPADPAPRSAATLAAVVERPLFSPSRRPPPPAVAPAAPAAPLEAAAPAWRVEGVIDAGGVRRAILRRAGAASSVHAAEGDAIEGWTVRSISADRVILGSPSGEAILPAR